jgi:hypothetical protein
MRLLPNLSHPRNRHLWVELLISLCFAFIVWLYIHSRGQQTLERVQIPVVVQLPPHQRDHFAIELPGSPKITASFSGSASRLRDLHRKIESGKVQAVVTYMISEDRQNESSICDILRVESSHLRVPPGVFAELHEESVPLPITVHRIVERTLPAKLEYSGDVRLSQLKLEPATVLVRGPKAVLDRAQYAPTAPYVFSKPSEDLAESETRDVAEVVTELEGRPIQTTPKQVTFKAKVQPKKRIYDVADLPIQFLTPPGFPFRVRFQDEKAAKTTLKVVGPTGEENPPVLAFVDLTKGSFSPGRNLEPLRLQLPKEFHPLDARPILVTFVLEEPERLPAAQVKLADPE